MEQRNHRHRKGDLFECRVELKIGRNAPLVVREADADPVIALARVFTTAERQLHAVRGRRRTVARHPTETLPLGRVERVFTHEGYGFLTDGQGREVYFDENAVVDGEFAALTPGAQVRFVEADEVGDNGPQASSVHARRASRAGRVPIPHEGTVAALG
jgi:cold shock CspA family protein